MFTDSWNLETLKLWMISKNNYYDSQQVPCWSHQCEYLLKKSWFKYAVGEGKLVQICNIIFGNNCKSDLIFTEIRPCLFNLWVLNNKLVRNNSKDPIFDILAIFHKERKQRRMVKFSLLPNRVFLMVRMLDKLKSPLNHQLLSLSPTYLIGLY